MVTERAEKGARVDVSEEEGVNGAPAIVGLIRRLHFLGGLAVAPFLLLVSITGIANAFTPQIVDAVHGDQLFVAPQHSPRHPLSEQVDVARTSYPNGELQSVVVPAGINSSTRVVFSMPDLPDIDPTSDENLTVYIDPYTDRILGDGVTVKDRPSAQVWLRQLHGNLHLGEPGRLYSEFATSCVPALVVAGLFLAAERRRRNRIQAPTRRLVGRWDMRTVHVMLGAVLSAGLVGMAVTGMPQSSYVGDSVDSAASTLGMTERELEIDKVAPQPEGDKVAPQPEGDTGRLDSAIVAARSSGLHGDLTITMPSMPGSTFQIQEKPRGWPIESDSVTVHPYSFAVIEHVKWEDQPLAARVITIGNHLHDGTLLGIANQIIVVTIAVGASILLVLGYGMWWRRRPNRVSFPSAPAGDYRKMRRTTILGICVVVFLLVWFVPLLGLGFGLLVLIDVLTQRRKQLTI